VVPAAHLFERMLAQCNLPPMIGRGLLERALRDEGADPRSASVAQWLCALPRIEARLRTYAPADAVTRRMRRMRHYLSALQNDPEAEYEESLSTATGRTWEELKAEHERGTASGESPPSSSTPPAPGSGTP
jgi:hypothetical protein